MLAASNLQLSAFQQNLNTTITEPTYKLTFCVFQPLKSKFNTATAWFIPIFIVFSGSRLYVSVRLRWRNLAAGKHSHSHPKMYPDIFESISSLNVSQFYAMFALPYLARVLFALGFFVRRRKLTIATKYTWETYYYYSHGLYGVGGVGEQNRNYQIREKVRDFGRVKLDTGQIGSCRSITTNSLPCWILCTS